MKHAAPHLAPGLAGTVRLQRAGANTTSAGLRGAASNTRRMRYDLG
jgi:hypothetical protein